MNNPVLKTENQTLNQVDSALLRPEDQVLSTLEADGSRRWLQPKLSKHRWLQLRRILAYILIAIFTLVPFVKINDKPLILFDIPARQFTIFGYTFLPTDTVLLAVLVVGLLLSVFLFTALWGRVWCGWACPQTVYMEFVFRPIERLFDGTVGRGGKSRRASAWRTFARYLVYFLVCVYLANTFLAYFVGVDRLSLWVTQSPLKHPLPFLVMAAVTIAMLFDFCFFREQMCTIACPYGRFQSVLLDQNSLIVAYDKERGEPRGKARKKQDGALPILGDCVDCHNCVTTCPTGIDIRDGLQMECINCTQCIDACNLVMEKLKRKPNLIRYSSQSHDRSERTSFFRARTIAYPLLLVGIASLFFAILFTSKSFDAIVLRELGNPHSISDDGRVLNLIRLKLTNRSDQPMQFTASVVSPQGVEIQLVEEEMRLEKAETKTFHTRVFADRNCFTLGRAAVQIKVDNQVGESRILDFKMIGPYE